MEEKCKFSSILSMFSLLHFSQLDKCVSDISLCVSFFNYFDVDHFLKSLCWVCYSIVSILCFGFWLRGMRNRSSSTRNGTCVLALEGEVLTTELLGKSHHCGFNMHFSNDYTSLHWASLYVLIGHVDAPFLKYLSKCFSHFEKLGCVVFSYEFIITLCIV